MGRRGGGGLAPGAPPPLSPLRGKRSRWGRHPGRHPAKRALGTTGESSPSPEGGQSAGGMWHPGERAGWQFSGARAEGDGGACGMWHAGGGGTPRDATSPCPSRPRIALRALPSILKGGAGAPPLSMPTRVDEPGDRCPAGTLPRCPRDKDTAYRYQLCMCQ